MLIDHSYPAYRKKWLLNGKNRWNGAFYYSKEIVDNIIPLVKTNRNWITINIPNVGCDHSIVFIHNNLHPEYYDWLKNYNDLLLVCGIPETCEKMSHLGTAIYLPLSVNVEEIQQFITEKTEEIAFVGRKTKRKGCAFPENTHYIEGLPRKELLSKMANYKKVYAVGRTAIEAKVLGCEILPYDPRFPDPSRWKILDNKDAARILQSLLDEVDGGNENDRS